MSKPPRTPLQTPAAAPEKHKCCGTFAATVSDARMRKRSTPQPWAVRKMWILVTFGIIAYTGYVYVGRLCLPMIERQAWAAAGRTIGIALLIVFGVLYLWTIWAYVTVVLTSPGYARDHVEKTPKPPLSDFSASTHHALSAPPTERGESPERHRRSISEKPPQITPQDSDTTAGPSYEHSLRTTEPTTTTTIFDSTTPHHPLPTTDTIPTPVEQQQQHSPRDARSRTRKLRKDSDTARNDRLDQLNVFRKPSPTPVLQPVFRYCDADEFVRPFRAHHCRACGTCVLRYDHHCPWIGQCVGARNHKFFLNFCFATSLFTAFILASVLFSIVRSTTTTTDLDTHLIVLLVLAVLFWLFTTSLAVSHTRLIMHGQTTVESMHIRAAQEKEGQTLARGFEWWECGAKRRRRKAFDEEWGEMNTEGNVWWRGCAYKEWTDVMGQRWLGWILPIGKGLSDGLAYPINPRFDEDGRLRKRSEWPEGLR